MAAAADPVAAVLDAHRAGELIRLRTSGTTGEPRHVLRTTASWFDSFPAVSALLDLGPSSHLLVPGPLRATMNLFAAVHATHVGARLTRGHAAGAGVSHAVVTPAALSRWLAHGEDVEGLHLLVAGDRLRADLHDRALAAGAAALSHYYGAAELSFVAWGAHADDLRPFPGVAVEAREGELWVRSPYIVEGYDGPAGPLRRSPDGFATVGDRGDLTDGRVVVSGRGDDAVVTAGVTVLVADVEGCLGVGAAGEVVVVGVPHPDLGQVLCAVLTDTGAAPALRRRAADRLDPAQRPRRWFVASELPLTTAGKVDRPRLAHLLATGARGLRRVA